MISAKPKVSDEAASIPACTGATSRRSRPCSPGGSVLAARFLQEVQRVGLRDAGRRNALDRRAVELLEMVERLRHRLGGDVRDRR